MKRKSLYYLFGFALVAISSQTGMANDLRYDTVLPADTLEGSQVSPAPFDPEIIARGENLAREACVVMLGPDRSCRFEIKAVPEMSVGFDKDGYIFYASPEFLELVEDDEELRAAFAWSASPGDHDLEGFRKALKWGRYGVGITAGVVATAGVIYMLLVYDLSAVSGVEYLVIIAVLPIDAAMRITNRGILETTRTSVLASKDRKTMKALAKNGYNPDSLLSLLKKVQEAEHRKEEYRPENIIGFFKELYRTEPEEIEFSDQGLGEVDEDRISEVEQSLVWIEMLNRN